MLQLESRRPSVATAGRYRLDVDRCIVEFSVRHMMLSTVRGRVRPQAGDLTIDPVDPQNSWVRVDLDAASLDTANGERDAALRAPALLDTDEFSVIRFESVLVSDRGDGHWIVTGDL